MANDIRLNTDVFEHPKIITLQRLLGSQGVLSLIKLWCYAGKFCTSGSLGKMSVEEIEKAAQWTGKKGKFVTILLELKLLKKRNNFCIINDWNLHQPYVFSAKKRTKIAQKAAKARWQINKKQDVNNTKKGDAQRMLNACYEHQFSNAKSMPHIHLLSNNLLIDNKSSSMIDIHATYKSITQKDLTDDDFNIIRSYDDDLILAAFEKMRKYRGKSAAYLIKILKSLKADQDITNRENIITDEKLLENFLATCKMYPDDMTMKEMLKLYKGGNRYEQIKSIIESIGYTSDETIAAFQQRVKTRHEKNKKSP